MSEGPIFIDQFGTTPTQHQPPPEPWWKQGWQGRMELWKVFWVCFVFGHGFVIGIGGGVMVMALILGFAVDRGSLEFGLTGFAAGATLLVLSYTVFAVWSVVSIWRCAINCQNVKWQHSARGFVVFYCFVLLAPPMVLIA